MARLEIKDHSLVITIEGIDKLLTFRSSITVPLQHVRRLSVRPDLSRVMYMPVEAQFRGLHVPGSVVVGKLILADGSGNVFCDVRDATRTVAIDLEHDRYKRLIVDLSDPPPEQAKLQIEAAVGRRLPPSTLAIEKEPDQPRRVTGGTSR